jgi:hypothetical protein
VKDRSIAKSPMEDSDKKYIIPIDKMELAENLSFSTYLAKIETRTEIETDIKV